MPRQDAIAFFSRSQKRRIKRNFDGIILSLQTCFLPEFAAGSGLEIGLNRKGTALPCPYRAGGQSPYPQPDACTPKGLLPTHHLIPDRELDYYGMGILAFMHRYSSRLMKYCK